MTNHQLRAIVSKDLLKVSTIIVWGLDPALSTLQCKRSNQSNIFLPRFIIITSNNQELSLLLFSTKSSIKTNYN